MNASAFTRRLRRIALPVWLLAILSLVIAPTVTFSNPDIDAAEIRHGEIQFETIGDRLQIIQDSNQAIIEWDQFSIGDGETTEFIQPGSSAAALNRISGGRSNIDGLLKANGGLVFINPHGIIVGPTGQVDAGSFIASTLDISDDDFLGGGDLNFNGGSAEAIVNLGTIRANSGDAILIAAHVQNAGQLLAPEGLAGIAAGSDVLLQESGEERLFVRAGSGSIQNDPTGNIEGRVAELKAGGNVYGLAIQQHGRVAANGAVNEGGQIFLRANGGKIVNSTPVSADQITMDGGDGGEVELTPTSALTANEVELTTNGGKIAQLGSVTAVSEDAAPGTVTMNAGDGGDIELGALSRTAGEQITVSTLGGDVIQGGQLLGVASATGDGSVTIDAGIGGSVNLTMDSETSAGDVTVRANGGSIQSLGHVVGNDGGSVNFEANDGGEIVVPLGGLIEAGSVDMKASGGTIDHAGTIIAESVDGKGGQVNLDVTPGGAITIQPTGVIEGGDINVLAGGGTIKHSGLIKARDGDGNGGTVNMDAGAGGTVDVYGVIDAAGENGIGGTVTVTGEEVTIRAGALINASGRDGGGTINIGGGFGGNDPNIRNAQNTTIEAGAVLQADATGDGPGGNVVVWANGTTNFAGTISARGAGSGIGGNAEVSGKGVLNFGGLVDLGSESGVGGNLLLDPGDFTIDTYGANMVDEATAITNALNSGANVTVTTNPAIAGNGDVFVNAQIDVDSVNQGVFSILAHRHIYVDEQIQLSGDGGAINLIAGWDGSTGYSPVPTPGIATPVGVPDMMEFPGSNGFGNNGGSVLIGTNTVTSLPVWVGTRTGPTAILGYDLVVQSAPSYHTGVGYVGAAAETASGEISVDVRNNVTLTAGNGAQGRARIGHELGTTGSPDITGKIFVNAGGDIQLSSAADPLAVASIGHYVPFGSVTGTGGVDITEITVRAEGDLTVTSGGADAFIGNYARTNDADIAVDAANIALDATNGKAFIGHTNGEVPMASAQGGIAIRAHNRLDLTDGGSTNWRIGHEAASGASASPIAVGIGSLGATGTFAISQDFADRVILPAIDHGSVSIAAIGPPTGAAIGAPAGPSGGLTSNATLNYTSDNDLNLLSTGVLSINGPITNNSTTGGNVNGVAGWDSHAGFPGPAGPGMGGGGPGEFDSTQLVDDPSTFGRNRDVLEVGGAISTGGGNINLFGGNIAVGAGINPGAGTTSLHLGNRPGGEVKFDGAHVFNATVFGHSTSDRIQGPDLDVNWEITADNAGTFAGVSGIFPTVNFTGLEIASGGTAADQFRFTNLASLGGGVFGGGGADILFIDNSGSTADHNVTITGNRVSINPVYNFDGIETVGYLGGSGVDNVSTRFFSFQQNLMSGGSPAGGETLGVIFPAGAPNPGMVNPLTLPGFGPINFSGFDALVLARAANGEIVGTKVIDAPAALNPTGNEGVEGIRVRDLEEIGQGRILANIAPVLANQVAQAQSQISSETEPEGNNQPEPVAVPQEFPNTPQNNTPPGQPQDITNESGPVEIDNIGSRPSDNIPANVQQAITDMFNPGDWQGTGLNIN